MAQQSKRHHFVPCFYTRRWTGRDGNLSVFTRPRGTVVVHRRSPKATGFEPNLYRVSGLPPELQAILEDGFFKTTDQLASDALQFMEATGHGEMPHDLRNGWSRLIISFERRSPEQIAALMRKAHAVLERLLASTRDIVGTGDVPHVSNMHWRVVNFSNNELSLLTCDHPVIRTAGFALPDALVFLPIGPRRLFVAGNHADLGERLEKLNARWLMSNVNSAIVSQAQRFVFGVDDRQLRFVENRMRGPEGSRGATIEVTGAG